MNQGVIDLHLHTNHSDGYHSPAEVVSKARKAGLRAIGITDHDEISALPEAEAAGLELGVEVVTGVELSVYFQKQDIHILGYCFDRDNGGLNDYLAIFKSERVKRAGLIVDKLSELGMTISLDDVFELSGTGSVGRPHIANVLLSKGLVSSFQEVFDKYLGDGKPANVPKYRMDIEKAIEIVTGAGGICSIAHPGIQLSNKDVMAVIRMGIHGIEATHPKHGVDRSSFYRHLARNHGLVATGGSDFHGGARSEAALGKYTVPYETIAEMNALAGIQEQEGDRNDS